MWVVNMSNKLYMNSNGYIDKESVWLKELPSFNGGWSDFKAKHGLIEVKRIDYKWVKIGE
jgi:hypothetical protein